MGARLWGSLGITRRSTDESLPLAVRATQLRQNELVSPQLTRVAGREAPLRRGLCFLAGLSAFALPGASTSANCLRSSHLAYDVDVSPQSLRWLGAKPRFWRGFCFFSGHSYQEAGLVIVPAASVIWRGSCECATAVGRSCLKNVGLQLSRPLDRLRATWGLTMPTALPRS